jgi:hypothetical protein
MKLAIKTEQLVSDVSALQALNVSGLSDQTMRWVQSENRVYMYYSLAKAGHVAPNSGIGFWEKQDPNITVLYIVEDNYDFVANNATDLSSQLATLMAGSWLRNNYVFTYNDINSIADIIGWEAVAKQLEFSETTVTSLSPKIDNINNTDSTPNSSTTLQITGHNFDTNTFVLIPGLDGTIDDVRVISGTSLEVDVTYGSTQNNYSIILYNGVRNSTDWDEDLGLNAIRVLPIPTGPERVMRIASATGNNYTGTAFAKTEYPSSSFYVDRAFDNNNGTRHYCNFGQSQDHYAGIIMSQPTLITKVSYRGEYGSAPFRLEGSNTTTDGTDGTWVDLGSYNFNNSNTQIPNDPVYLAFRLVWTNPSSTTWANAREIRFSGRQ